MPNELVGLVDSLSATRLSNCKLRGKRERASVLHLACRQQAGWGSARLVGLVARIGIRPLVGLVGGLSATSKKPSQISTVYRQKGSLSVLSVADNRQGSKKLNEIKACRLVGLVAPTEGRRGPTSPLALQEAGG
jgi:hypothetical protein